MVLQVIIIIHIFLLLCYTLRTSIKYTQIGYTENGWDELTLLLLFWKPFRRIFYRRHYYNLFRVTWSPFFFLSWFKIRRHDGTWHFFIVLLILKRERDIYICNVVQTEKRQRVVDWNIYTVYNIYKEKGGKVSEREERLYTIYI